VPFPPAVYLIYLAVGLAGLLVQLVAIVASKVRIEEIQLFYGQALATYDLGRIQLHLGWIPLGCSAKYDIHQLAQLPTIVRVGIVLIPSVFLLGLGLLLLGPEQGWHHFVTGFRQTVEGILRPQAVGYPLVGKLHALYQQSPVTTTGVICAKWAAWSLMPVGHVGGLVLSHIFSPPLRRREKVDWVVSLAMLVGFLATVVWMGIFLVYAVKHWA